jgi:NADH:ubiquinone oxidoreductase subunit 2 (subunit N)
MELFLIIVLAILVARALGGIIPAFIFAGAVMLLVQFIGQHWLAILIVLYSIASAYYLGKLARYVRSLD